MGLVSKLRGELVDIVEWVGEYRNTLVWRFPHPPGLGARIQQPVQSRGLFRHDSADHRAQVGNAAPRSPARSPASARGAVRRARATSNCAGA